MISARRIERKLRLNKRLQEVVNKNITSMVSKKSHNKITIIASSKESPTSNMMIDNIDTEIKDKVSNGNSIQVQSSPLDLNNGVVPQQIYRYLNSRLQSKFTKVTENGFEGSMSPSPYDLGYKFNRSWQAIQADYVIAYILVSNKLLHHKYSLQSIA